MSHMILDIGCGNHCRGDVGIDISFAKPFGRYDPKKLDKVAGTRNRNARLITCDLNAEVLPFKDDSFDVVKAIHILEHLNSPYTVLEEIYRVLKLGGSLLWICPNPLFSFLTDRVDKQHIYSWSSFSAVNMLKAVGFVVIKLSIVRTPTLDLYLRCKKVVS